MSERCGVAHPDHPAVTCNLREATSDHEEHLGYLDGEGIIEWPNPDYRPKIHVAPQGRRRATDVAADINRSTRELKLGQFGGETYQPEFDIERLGRQLRAVYDLMSDGEWRTLAEIGATVDEPEASISARLRDLRKPDFGGFEVLRRRRGEPSDGIFEYRLELA